MGLRALLLLSLVALCVLATESDSKSARLKRWVEASKEAPRKRQWPEAAEEDEESHIAEYILSPSGEQLALCKPGYTGANCQNPICTKHLPVNRHAYASPPGELITYFWSDFCTGNFSFPVDSEIKGELFIEIEDTVNGNPQAYLYDPNGKELLPSNAENMEDNGYVGMFKTSVPGEYTLRLTSMTDNPCISTVSAITSLTVDGGFVTDKRDDNVQMGIPKAHQGITRFPTEGISSYLAFVVNGETFPGAPQNVIFYENGRPVNGTFGVQQRYQCGASSILDRAYICGDASDYMAAFVGVDNDGYTWQRVYEFSCNAPIDQTTPVSPTGPTPPPTPAPTSCDNNGLLLNPGQNNASCYCGAYYTGSRCEYKICFNGGAVNELGDCDCPFGFQDAHCTAVVCPKRTGRKFDGSQRAFVYVIRSSSTMSKLQDQIKQAATESIAIYETLSPGYFQSFVLVAFNNHQLVLKQSYQTSADFLAALDNIQYAQDTACMDSVYQPLLDTLTSTDVLSYPLSPIFVFSDALPDDSEAIQIDLVTQLGQFRGPIYFLLATNPSDGCQVDPAAPSYNGLRQIAQYSRGLVSRLDYNSVATSAVLLAKTVKEADTILTNDFLDSCNNAPKFQSVFVDESSRSMYIIAAGNSFNATIISPNRKTLKPKTVFSSGDFYIGEFPVKYRGNYLVNVATGDGTACQYRVVEKNRYQVFFGTAKSLNDDFSSPDPLFNHSSALVVRMNDLHFYDTTNVYTEATVWTNDVRYSDKRVVLHAANGLYRDGCDFNLIYGGWTCPYRDLIFYMTIFIDDRRGFTVERTVTGMCRARPPVGPAPGGCLNGGVPAGANGTCLCAPGFQGDKCQQIVCQNGGQAKNGYCSCPAGFAGQFCEIEACIERNPNAYFDPMDKSISLFIHDTLFTRTAIQQIMASMPRFLQGLYHQHPQWIAHYQLVRFNDTGFTVFADTDDPVKFADGMVNLYERNEANTEFSCKDLDILELLHGTLNSTGVTRGGIVFVFINGLIKSDMVNYENLLEQTALTKISLNFVQMGGNPCGHSVSDPGNTMMMGLATISGGEYIQAMGMDAGNVLTSIPYLYSSSLIYENYFDDCATKECSFYFPTDSQTQAFTANIIGDISSENNGDVHFTAPVPKSSYTPIPLYNSVGVASQMRLVTRPCDDGWYQTDLGMCVKYVKDPVTWAKAQQICYESRATMAITFDKKEQEGMDINAGSDYWMGLNDIDTLGQWRWGRQNDRNPLTLNVTKYTNWAKGQPVISDSTRCVYQSKKADGWIVADCGAQKPFICVKSSYDYNYFPGAEGRSKLPSGMWKLTVKTYEGPALVKIRAQSSIRVFFEYTTLVHADVGSSVLLAGNTTQNHIIAHVTNLVPPSEHSTLPTGSLEFAQLYQNKNMSMLAAVPFYARSNCAYDFISRPFHCPSEALSIVASGVDSHGYEFQRIVPAICYGGDQTHTCENGGFYDEKKQSCICPPTYMGDRCEVPICKYGWVSGGLTCKCAYGYIGRFCQTPMCYKQHESPVVDTPLNKTLAIIFDGTSYGLQTSVIDNFEALMNTIITKATSMNSQWFYNYVGIVFRDPKAPVSVSKVVSTSNAAQFIQQMKAELTSNVFQSTSVDRSIMQAIRNVLLRNEVAARSQAFLITSGLPVNPQSVNFTMDADARNHVYINTILMGDQGLPGSVSHSDPRAEALYEVTFNSGGGFYQVPDFPTLKQFVQGDVGTLFDNYYITSRVSRNCSGLYEYFDVSSQSTMLTFDLYASNAVVSVKDPIGRVYNSHNLTTLISTKTNKFMLIQNRDIPPGIWQVSVDNHVKDPGSCLVNIRGVNTNNLVSIAYSQDDGNGGAIHSDLYSLDPMPQQLNAILVKSNFGTAKYVQIFSANDRKLFWASPLIKRFNCHYQYSSQEMFACPTEHLFLVAVDGEDDNGHPYRREFHAHCI
ncbi:hypothetical protein QR680_017675 [Steinernema hermaphroditum]|uniref:Uncharacterized protein n=1 Tax=Steinernema hermaphroditum TaxID=289476 RepID=A0AA39HHM5_9BILA|nr:hypothetical protein QR680_017675 [Steinernema hermaphroditum]